MFFSQFRFYELFFLCPSGTTLEYSPTQNQDVRKPFYLKTSYTISLSVKQQKLPIDSCFNLLTCIRFVIVYEHSSYSSYKCSSYIYIYIYDINVQEVFK